MSNPVLAPWVVVENDPTDRAFLMVHNTFTARTFRLRKKLAGTPLGAKADRYWTNFLLAEKMLVAPERILPMLEERLHEFMFGFAQSAATAVLLPTYRCQLACTYCFTAPLREAVEKTKKRLPPEKIAKKLIAYYEHTPAFLWKLTLTGGGEPMMAFDYIHAVARLVHEAALEQGRIFTMNIVTNAQALTPAKAKKLAKVGLASVAVTIDPDHDATRPLKNGKGTFETILDNLLHLPPEVTPNLQFNMKAGDEKALAETIEKVALLRGRVRVCRPAIIFEPLTGDLPPSPKPGESFRQLGPKEVDTLIAAGEILLDHGFPSPPPFPHIGCETYRWADHFFINFAGEETMCPGLDNQQRYRTDTMSDEEGRRRFDMRLANPQWKTHCVEADGSFCPYLPKCWGGCRLNSVGGGYDWGVINCEKVFFDKTTRYSLRHWND